MPKYTLVVIDEDNTSGLEAFRIVRDSPFHAISMGEYICFSSMNQYAEPSLSRGAKYVVKEVLHDFLEKSPSDPDRCDFLLRVTVKKV